MVKGLRLQGLGLGVKTSAALAVVKPLAATLHGKQARKPKSQVVYGLEDGEEVSPDHLEQCKKTVDCKAANDYGITSSTLISLAGFMTGCIIQQRQACSKVPVSNCRPSDHMWLVRGSLKDRSVIQGAHYAQPTRHRVL